MIKVKNKIIEKIKTIKCLDCGCELEYEDSDLKIGMYGCKGFECPECGEFVLCTNRVADPHYPETFYLPKNAVTIDNDEINELLDKVKKEMANTKPGEFQLCATGDTTVIGLKYNGEENYYVCKNAAIDEVFYDV